MLTLSLRIASNKFNGKQSVLLPFTEKEMDIKNVTKIKHIHYLRLK